MSQKNKQRGSVTVIGIIVAAVLIIGGGVTAYYLTTGPDDSTAEPSAITNAEEASHDETKTSGNEDDGLPKGFPENMPIYTPSSKTTASSIPMSGGTTYTVGFRADGTAQDVKDFYAKKLNQNGWSINEDVSSRDNGRFVAKNENMSVTTTITEAGSIATFTLQVTEQTK